MHRSLMGDNDFATMIERGQIVGTNAVSPTAEWEESGAVPRAVKLISMGIVLGLALPAMIPELLLVSVLGFVGMIVGAFLIPHIDKWMKSFLCLAAVHVAWRVGLLVMGYFPVDGFTDSTAFTIFSVLFGAVGVGQLFVLGRGVYLRKGISFVESLLLPAAYALSVGCGFISHDVIRPVAQGACVLVIIAVLIRVYRSAE